MSEIMALVIGWSIYLLTPGNPGALVDAAAPMK